jgi:hypothetical protein
LVPPLLAFVRRGLGFTDYEIETLADAHDVVTDRPAASGKKPQIAAISSLGQV